MEGLTKEGRYLIAHAQELTMKKRFPSTHWRVMGIGGRIPPLLEALALLIRRILPWFDFFVMQPALSRQSLAPAEPPFGAECA